MNLNQRAFQLLQKNRVRFADLNVGTTTSNCGAQLYDFGIEEKGGLDAGCLLAELCMAGLSTVSSIQDSIGQNSADQMAADLSAAALGQTVIHVETESPIQACMGAQYAGWPISHGKYFAMGSGPMRAVRGKEQVLKELNLTEESDVLVGVLETEKFPDDEVLQSIASECSVNCEQLHLLLAPTTSLAGTVQVVARSVETALHKLFEIGFDLKQIVTGSGEAPLPPIANDSMTGIGWTNDAILYAGRVHLVVDTEDATIEELGAKVPSSASADFGQPFAEIFERYDRDFYKIDPLLFSPAVVMFENRRTGNRFAFGEMRWDVLLQSFSIEG